MCLLVVASLGLAVAAAPAWGLDSTSPGSDPALGSCHGSAECPVRSGLYEAQEDGSLLQVHGSSAKQVALAGTSAATTGPGCPNKLVMDILQGVASSEFKQRIKEYLPLHANHSFVNQTISYENCSGTITATAGMTVDADLKLEQLSCNSATCAKGKFLCKEYKPLNASIAVTAPSMTFEAFANGGASWDAGCAKVPSGSVSVDNGKTSFTVVNLAVRLTGAMDLVVNPPDATSPQISELEITYDSIEDIQCTEAGKTSTACVDAISYLNTAEFKEAMGLAIERSLSYLNEQLIPALEAAGTSLEQLAAEPAEPHPQA